MSDTLRILVVTNLWPVAGGYRGIFVREQVEAVAALGHHVDVEVIAQSRGRADYLLSVPRIRRRLRAGDYDVVHVHYGLSAPAARLAVGLAGRSGAGVPRLVTLHGSDVDVRWQRLVTQLGLGGGVRRIYGCRRLAEAMGDPGGQVIPIGVDLSLFAPVDRSAARARLDIGPDERVVLFGAHPDNPVKGYDVFRDVLATLRSDGLPVRELVLARLARARHDVPPLFAAADVLLCTSRRGTESGPAVVKEAAVMGLPVVSVAVGDVAEVLDGVTPSAVVAFPEPWGGPAARRELVSRLARRCAEVLAAGRRSNGREHAARLDSRTTAARVVEAYRQALAT